MAEKVETDKPAEPTPFEPRYSLEEAAAKFFPGGQITKKSLRTEIRKGRLRAESIAAKYVVTERAIREMCEACALVPQKDKDVTCLAKKAQPASISANPEATAVPSGISLTERKPLAQAQLQRTLEKLKKPSQTTAPTTTSRRVEQLHPRPSSSTKS